MLLKRAPEGTGVIAGGPARAVIGLAGIKNIRTKCMGSRNKQNVVLATIEGLRQLKTPEEVADLAENLLMRFWLKEECKNGKHVKVTLVKSPIGAVPKHKKTVAAMGLTKMHKTVEMPDNAATRGMIQQVQHLVKVEEA